MVTPIVGLEYDLGTDAYRALTYARAIADGVPPGVPLVLSDDRAVWRAAQQLAARNVAVGVLHADDELYYGLARDYAGAVGGLVSVSERIRKRASALPGVGSLPSAVIPCGTPLPPPVRRPGESGVLRLVWIGRMDERQKRVSDLPKIAAALRARGAGCVIDVFGDGADREPVRRSAAALGVGDRFRFRGWRPSAEIQEHLAASDILVLPSNFEGMPVCVMEALAVGCAVVASRVSGTEDYEHHALARDCYWLHDVGDTEAAARLIVAAASVDPAARAAAARRLAAAVFSVSASVRHYREFIASLPRSTTAGGGVSLRQPALAVLTSHALAATRVARLWARGRYPAGRS